MFTEISRKEKVKRIRMVHFDNYIPGKISENKKTPDNVVYAKNLDKLKNDYDTNITGILKGKSGIMIINRTQTMAKTEYENYTEDGKTFYNGYEKFEYLDLYQSLGRLESNVIVTGENTGKMELNLTMNTNGFIIYEKEGEIMSSGFAEYNGKKIYQERSAKRE